MVFVVVNNGWAISVPVAEQTATRTLAQKAVAAGIPGIQVDGNDVFAVRDTVAAALDTARQGGGPTLIETLTYRLSDHTTADDSGRYRNPDEVKQAWALEPLIRVRDYLAKAGAWSSAEEQAWTQECAHEIEAAVNEYLKRSKPPTDAMFDHLFDELPRHLVEQREVARKYGTTAGGTSSGSSSGH
jgi:2-oxoisovalerate dehydrogenase E1 component alpha subunit